MTMHALLSIVSKLEALGRTTTLELLRPGLSRTETQARLEQLHLTAPDDLQNVYAWHNGTDATTGAPLDDLHLFPGFYLLSLEDASENYLAFREDTRWNAAWLPVFANGGGDFYAVACRDNQSAWGSVVHYRIDEFDHPVEFASVGAFLETIASAFENGVFYVDAAGYLEMNDREWVSLASHLNGEVPYWRAAR